MCHLPVVSFAKDPTSLTKLSKILGSKLIFSWSWDEGVTDKSQYVLQKNQRAGYESASAGKDCDQTYIKQTKYKALTNICRYGFVYTKQETRLMTLSQVKSQMPY